MASLQKLFGDTLGRLIFKRVAVSRITALGPHFRLIEVEGEVGAPRAGDKMQVHLEEGLRTYTPFGFKAGEKRVQFLAWVHSASTPGSRWARELRVGDAVSFFGPRSSLALEALEGPVVLVGDETSFAVARALTDAGRGGVQVIAEVEDPSECATVLEALSLRAHTLVARTPGGQHLGALNAAVCSALQRGTPHLVLTGNARTIQAVRAGLKQAGLPAPKLTKAYWAPGKRGLD